MIKIMNSLPLVAAITITLLPGIAYAEDVTQQASSGEIASVEPVNTQATPNTQNETKIEVAQLPSKEKLIEGKAEKRKKSVAKVDSSLADLLFSGDYPDGYTSFASF